MFYCIRYRNYIQWVIYAILHSLQELYSMGNLRYITFITGTIFYEQFTLHSLQELYILYEKIHVILHSLQELIR